MKKMIEGLIISLLFCSCLFDNKKEEEKEPKQSSNVSLPTTTDAPSTTNSPPDLDTIVVH